MDNIEFSLDQKTTVIFGINGVGKSTILKAIDLLYANIIAKLTKKKTTEFDKDDISYGKSKATIEAKFVFEDGEKCTISLFGDLARRMALANPGRENPLEGTGVVLIDELELHMHTSWQRKVLGVLKETFPNIQFIITTHSPQILGELDDKYNLVYLKKEI